MDENQTVAAVCLGAWALFFLIALAAAGSLDMQVFWGRHGFPGRVAMSRRSRLAFVAAAGLMIGVIVSGVTASVLLKPLLALFLVAVAVCLASGALDARDHQKRG